MNTATIESRLTATCRVCAATFAPFNTLQIVCGIKCARQVPIINRRAEKNEKADTRRKLAALKPRSKWLQEAQAAFNAFIRARDAEQPCISCNRHHEGSYDAGHYLTTGARPELRFDEDNVHKQCVPCNRHLHGNLVLYRMGLIRRIGTVRVDRLEGPHEPLKYGIAELQVLRDTYRAKERAMAAGVYPKGWP